MAVEQQQTRSRGCGVGIGSFATHAVRLFPSQTRTHTSETSCVQTLDLTHTSVHCIHVLSTAHVRPSRAHGTCESALTVHWLVQECSPSLAVDRHGALLPVDLGSICLPVVYVCPVSQSVVKQIGAAPIFTRYSSCLFVLSLYFFEKALIKFLPGVAELHSHMSVQSVSQSSNR
jgi:hypothetical protein